MCARPAVWLVLLVLVAGCTDGPADPTTTATDGTTTATPAPDAQNVTEPLPADLHEEVAFDIAFDVLAAFDFTLPRAAAVEATLSWSLPTNDLDLWLLRGDAEIEQSAESLTQSEVLTVALIAGDYVLEVRTPLVAVADTFVLDVLFAEAMAPDGSVAAHAAAPGGSGRPADLRR